MQKKTSTFKTSYKNSIGTKVTVNEYSTMAILTDYMGDKFYMYDTPNGIVVTTKAGKKNAFKYAEWRMNALEIEIKFNKEFVTKMREYGVSTDYFPKDVVLSRHIDEDDVLIQVTSKGVYHYYEIVFGTVIHLCGDKDTDFGGMVEYITNRIGFARTPHQKFMYRASFDYNWKFTS